MLYFYQNRIKPKEYKIRQFSILLLVALNISRSCQAQPKPNEQDNIYRTLIAGLNNRETIVENKSIAGIASEKSFISEAWWKRIDDGAKGKAAREQGHYSDREMSLLRFNLSQRQWYYEVQQLLWAGWSPWFPINYTRKATDVSNLYQKTSCDGEKVSYYAEFPGYPTGLMEPLTEPKPGLDQGFFRKWLGLGLQRSFSKILFVDEAKARLAEIKKEKIGEHEAYVVSIGATPDDFTEGRAWIAPDVGFAIVKWESIRISRTNPKVGSRFVIEWSDFKDVNGLLLPHHYVEQEFVYSPQRSSKDTWQSWHEVTFSNLQLNQNFNLNPFDTMMRVGTKLNGFIVGLPLYGKAQVDLEKAKAEYFTSRKPWDEAEVFHSIPLPQIDPAYTAPLTGQEVVALATKYKFPAP